MYKRINRKLFGIFIFIVSMTIFISGCSTIPITGRRQLNIIPAGQLISISNNEFDQIISKSKLSTNYKDTVLVEKVGQNIANASELFVSKYMQGHNSINNWEFKLIQDDSIINAFCLSGGKVGVYTGMLKVANNDDSLATVMAHEIAHSILNHHGERMSHLLLVQLGGITLNEALKNKPNETKQFYELAYGLGTNVGFVLPYSRVQEYEADRIGLILMTIAGYDPREAIYFWEKMKHLGQLMPVEFLSTHPTPDNRIDQIKALIPEANEYSGEIQTHIFQINRLIS